MFLYIPGSVVAKQQNLFASPVVAIIWKCFKQLHFVFLIRASMSEEDQQEQAHDLCKVSLTPRRAETRFQGIKHFESNVHSLRISITRRFVKYAW